MLVLCCAAAFPQTSPLDRALNESMVSSGAFRPQNTIKYSIAEQQVKMYSTSTTLSSRVSTVVKSIVFCDLRAPQNTLNESMVC